MSESLKSCSQFQEGTQLKQGQSFGYILQQRSSGSAGTGLAYGRITVIRPFQISTMMWRSSVGVRKMG